MLELKDVFAGYRGHEDVLLGASLRLLSSQSIAIYGLNGSGKSTLLRVCAGLLKPRAGNVSSSFGRPGYLQQNPRMQFLASSVREEITLSLRSLHSQDTLSSAVDEWLNRFGLEQFSRESPRDLSGGQQQRVALAAILCRSPKLLLLDEPDAFLDGRSARDFRSFVREHCTDCAIIWTHSRRSSAPMADTFFELRDGKLALRNNSAE